MLGQALGAGRYRLDRVLGYGGMATVYLADDELLERPVAVKVLADNLAADPEFRARFVREARNAARLNHRNVVRVFDVDEATDGRPWLVMEYVDGPTLADERARRGPLPIDEVSDIAAQVAAGLDHAHRAGVIHRDIKPGNLLRASDGTVKIADFGIAKALDDTSGLTRTGKLLGTPAYTAPELTAGHDATPAADVWSLGAVLRELAGDVAPGHPLHRLIAACTEPDPARRPAAADVNALLRSRGGATQVLDFRSGTEPAAPTEEMAPPARRWPIVVGVAVVLVVAALLVAALRHHPARPTAASTPTTVAPPPTAGTTRPTTVPTTVVTNAPLAAAPSGPVKCSSPGRSFVGRDLSNADLRRADLRCAVMTGATLDNADLRNADLRGANLTGVSLDNADLRGARVDGVRWTGATCPDGEPASAHGGACPTRGAP